jgi:hypothetical protein
MTARLLLPLLLALGVLHFSALAQTPTPTPTPAPEPLLVFNLKLDKTGRSVNYTFFKNGFLVADPKASSFSTVVVLTDPNTFNFYQAGDFVTGTYNEIRDYAGRRHAILFGATAGTSASSDNAALQVIGPIDRHGGVGSGMSADYSNKMRGYFMASGAESQSTGNTFEYGYAGFSNAKAEFNKSLTRQVNGQALDIPGAIKFLEKYLSDRGVPGATPIPTPSPSPTPIVIE